MLGAKEIYICVSELMQYAKFYINEAWQPLFWILNDFYKRFYSFNKNKDKNNCAFEETILSLPFTNYLIKH